MKKYLILLLIPFLFSCGGGKKEIARLQASKDSLMAASQQKDASINDFIKSMNDIQGNLDSIKMKEEIITVNTGRGNELNKTAKEKIQEDINTIFQLVQKNKATIAQLSKKLKTLTSKTEEMQKMIDHLNQLIVERDTAIRNLEDKLAQLNIQIEAKNIAIDT